MYEIYIWTVEKDVSTWLIIAVGPAMVKSKVICVFQGLAMFWPEVNFTRKRAVVYNVIWGKKQ